MVRSQSEEPELSGGLAQLGERLLCKQNVAGSIPVTSTINNNMTLDKFAEIDVELSDNTLTHLNELAVRLPYNERSILTHYTNNLTLSLSSEIDKFVSEFECTMSIVRIMPACDLIWHKDVHPQRTCVINIPLKNYTNQVTYITDKDIQESFGQRNSYPHENVNKVIHKPYQIPYNYKKSYLINVSEKYHCVFNLTDEYRYLLSIQTGKLTYQQGVDYFTNLNLIANR